MNIGLFSNNNQLMVYSEEVTVRGNAVPVIIGVNGASIRKLQDEFNVKLYFLGLNTEQYAERPLRIIGNAHDVQRAKRRIIDISEGRDLEFYVTPEDTGSPSAASLMVTREFFAPTAITHLVLGCNGENLQSIKTSQNLRYAEAEGLRVMDDGREMQQIVLRGAADDIANAVKLLQQLTDFHAASQLTPSLEDLEDNNFNYNEKASKNEIDDDFWYVVQDDNSTDESEQTLASPSLMSVPLTSALSMQSISSMRTVNSSTSKKPIAANNYLTNNKNDESSNKNYNLSKESDFTGNNKSNNNGIIVDIGNEFTSLPLAYTTKYNPATNGIVHESTQTQIATFATRVNSLGEQHNRTIERASRAHCDDIIKAALNFVTTAEHEMQTELRQLRGRLAKAENELSTTRNDTKNGSGMFSVEISDLKRKLGQKDCQIMKMSSEIEQHKSTIEDLTLEAATLKCQQQDQNQLAKELHQFVQNQVSFSSSINCKKCDNEQMDTVLIPCLHLAYCKKCAFSMPQCAICNVKITSRLKINIITTKLL